ncbi:hypothetical protein HYV31_01470 [candidate division WWE3 bacterium]|nr:hypothetical protein [candidate division WWE3 bacterium]
MPKFPFIKELKTKGQSSLTKFIDQQGTIMVNSPCCKEKNVKRELR